MVNHTETNNSVWQAILANFAKALQTRIQRYHLYRGELTTER